MVQPMMFNQVLSRQKTFLAFTALRAHGREHNVWWILSRQKTFITLTALRVHGTDHDVCWISFSSKNVFHILCMAQHMMLHHFLRQKRFSHFPQAVAEDDSSHEFSSSVEVFLPSPFWKSDLKILNMWEYSWLSPQLSRYNCRTGRACAVPARRPRMRSNGAPATPTLARALGTYWDEFPRELGRIP